MIVFRLPSLGSDMDAGTLLQWRVAPGDTVQQGQVLAVVDTAKAAIDVECWRPGIVHRLLAEPGATLPVGAALALLREPQESAEAADRAWALAAPAAAVVQATAAVADVPALSTAAPPSPGPLPRPRVTPAARRRARALGIAPEGLAVPGGVVTLQDVEAAAAAQQGLAQQAPPPVAVPAAAPVRADAMRQVIAAAMARSKREIPHFYLTEDVPFQRAEAWLAARNAARPPAQRLLGAALLIAALARALVRHPGFNGFWRDGAFVAGDGIQVGVAVALRGGGLVAPALRDADRQGLEPLSAALHDLVRRARAGTLRSSELGAATVTASLLGDEGVRCVLGVIHPPQVALVGFGRVAPRPWVCDDGAVRAWPVVTVSLSADHRVADGHRGARLLAELRDRLQDPDALDTTP